MIDNSQPGTLYRFFDADDNLLYVGASIHPVGRLDTHRREKSWWPNVVRATFEHYETRHAAIVAEADAINFEKPKYNRAPGMLCARPEDQIEPRYTTYELHERRMRRTYYPVPGLRQPVSQEVVA